ncbi:hypothetical protein PAXRUDRAFT_742215 [Paxillus rubicundulus Ve08.2h10]|uniref:Uncharacterized protein n=1 Tax=Paxillus rubicundulus Ve08.2h10 TaxID=930991 RepID=A0A0D0EBP4_9AGAM|nr:hypothetical protein PAXRUDRAFT_742215 [Paxillus rubicundulus Ve08.2h10]
MRCQGASTFGRFEKKMTLNGGEGLTDGISRRQCCSVLGLCNLDHHEGWLRGVIYGRTNIGGMESEAVDRTSQSGGDHNVARFGHQSIFPH